MARPSPPWTSSAPAPGPPGPSGPNRPPEAMASTAAAPPPPSWCARHGQGNLVPHAYLRRGRASACPSHRLHLTPSPPAFISLAPHRAADGSSRAEHATGRRLIRHDAAPSSEAVPAMCSATSSRVQGSLARRWRCTGAPPPPGAEPSALAVVDSWQPRPPGPSRDHHKVWDIEPRV